MCKALQSPAPKKAPGPDGLMADLFRSPPSLVKPITVLFNVILRAGHFPASLLRLYAILLDKPKRPPDQCRSKRPISLISVLSKALETVILNRIMVVLEDKLADCQYAYRHSRGTEHHLLEMADFAREMRTQGEWIYIAPAGVDGAFDTVPSEKLMRTMSQLGMDCFVLRYLAAWLSRRVFSIRLPTPQGRFYSFWRRMPRGPPKEAFCRHYYGSCTSIIWSPA